MARFPRSRRSPRPSRCTRGLPLTAPDSSHRRLRPARLLLPLGRAAGLGGVMADAAANYRTGDVLEVLGRGTGRAPPQSVKQAVSAPTISGTSSAEASSRHECIASIGAPTSTVGMPSRVAVSGPIVLPARQVGPGDEPLHRHAGRGAALGEPAAGRGVGRVGLVGVDLEHRAAAELRLVRRLVPVVPGRVHRVRHVGRHQPRLASARGSACGSRRRSPRPAGGRRPRGSCRGPRTSSRCPPPRGRCRPAAGCAPPAGGQQRGEPGVAAARGRPAAGAATQVPSAPAAAAGWVSASTRSCPTTSSASTPAAPASAASSPGSPARSRDQTGTSCALRVQLQPVAHAAVEVDGQRRQPQRRAGQPDQRASRRRAAPPGRRR